MPGTHGRATPSLRSTPYAAETANPAGRHLSFAEICPDNRSQFCYRQMIDDVYRLLDEIRKAA